MLRMLVKDGDDRAFVLYVEYLTVCTASGCHPERIYVARMDNCFGDRWFGFRGKVMGAVGFHTRKGSGRFVVPPFVPERVLSEMCYVRTSEHDYTQIDVSERLAIGQQGAANLKRWLDEFTDSAILVWYSGNSGDVDRASVMLYVHTAAVTDGWYLGVRKENGVWQFEKGIRITKRDLDECQRPGESVDLHRR